MKIIVASYQCESNSRALYHPQKSDFEYFSGEDIFKKLKALGYDRYITIERETGSTPEDDILLAREYLENIWNSI